MKRVFIFIVGILFLLVALPHQSVYAQTPTPDQSQSTWKFSCQAVLIGPSTDASSPLCQPPGP